MLYLIVDGMMSGTGIRDAAEGGYLDPVKLGVSANLADRISRWLRDYESAHYFQYQDKDRVAALDAQGISIGRALQKELTHAKIEYYSSAELRKIPLGD
jgi:hypothetical protein